MPVFILLLSGKVVKGSFDLEELKQYVLDKLNENNAWNMAEGVHYIGYEILDVYIPLRDE